MTNPQIMMYSLWRNDEHRNIQARMRHLTDKTYGDLRWVWVCGDSSDATADILRDFAEEMRYHDGLDITVVEHFTGIEGMDHYSRLLRLSASCSEAVAQTRESDDYIVVHESDLQSPPDLIEQFLATGKDYVAGATWLDLTEGRVFYDVWAFYRNGKRFSNGEPYHRDWTDDELLEVDSFGSCWMVPAAPFFGPNGIRVKYDAAREMCGRLKRRDPSARFWLAPWIEIVQPRELWEPHDLSVEDMEATTWDK